MKTPKKSTFSPIENQRFSRMRTTLVVFALILAHTASAQTHNGQIRIEQQPGIDKLLAIYTKGIANAGHYTIQVGFGSYSQAESLKKDVEIDFPQWKAKIVFDSPTYRVQVGRFKSRLDAEREYLEVRKKYPAALLLRPEKEQR